MTRALPSLACVLWLLRVGLAHAQPAGEPVLRIEAGGHTGPITQLAVDRAGRQLATSSLDCTARLWDLQGDATRVLRLPPGAGALTAIALAPDGRMAAVGADGADPGQPAALYLLDRGSGEVLRHLETGALSIAHLRFSNDGRRLLAVLGWGGVRAFRMPGGEPAGQDGDCAGTTAGADLDRAGRLITTCDDGLLRLYDPALKLLRKGAAPGGGRPHGVRFSPDGGRIAVGYRGLARVDVLSGQDLSALYQPGTAAIDSGDLAVVGWSEDGALLYAAGTFRLKGQAAVRRWADGGRGGPMDAGVPASEVVALAGLPSATEPPDPRPEVLTRRLALARLSPQGGVAFASADGAVGVVLAEWQRVRLYGSPPVRLAAAELAVDLTGARVRFAYASGKPASFSVSEHALSPSAAPDSRLRRAVLSAPGLAVERADGQVLLNGAALALPAQERAQGLAVDPEGRRVLVGTERALRLFDGEGRPAWQAEVPAPVVAAAFSGDRRLAVATLADGTVRWLAAADGKALLALLPHRDRRRWVAWTPSGYYDASADGDDLIGWHLERGAGQAPDFFRASLLRDRLRRPDVIDRVLFTLDERRAREEADAEAGRTEPPLPLRRLLPPLVRVLSPADSAAVGRREVTLRLALRSPSGEPIVGLRALVQGRLVQARTALLQEAAPGRGIPEGERIVTVPVPPEDCTLIFVAETAHSAGEPATVRLRWSGPRDQKIDSQPDLYLLAVGISGYQQGRLRLEYAAKDARDLEAALRAQAGKAYRRVETRVLTDREATRGGILLGMKWLAARANPTDVSVLFLAGHGTSDPGGGRYYFLPQEADPQDLRKTALSAGELQQGLRRISGKVLLFLDTCHAGNVLDPQSRGATDLRRFANELASVESGVVVYAASSAGQLSQESPRWGNGAFTKALVEGLRGKADYGQRGRVTVSTLEHYISERVRELTREAQVPSLARPTTLPDFLVAAVPVRPPLHRRWWFWGSLTTGVAALVGAGIGLGGMRRSSVPQTDKGAVAFTFPLVF